MGLRPLAGGMSEADRARLTSVESVHVSEAVVDVAITTPAVITAHSGSFTARSSTVLFDVDISHQVLEHLGGHVSWFLLYGPAGADLTINTEAELSALGAGVVKKHIGAIASYAGAAHRKLALTGLTAGNVYDYAVACAVVGGFAQIALGKQPVAAAISKTESPALDSGVIVATRNNDDTMSLVKARHEYGYSDTVLAAQPLPAGGGRVAVTPDGSRAIATNLGGDNVTVVTTGLLTGAAPAVQGSYSTGAGSDPYAVVCERTNSAYAWVGMLATGTVRRVTLATGALGTAFSLDAPDSATGGVGLAISSDDAFLYACSQTDNKVYKVRTSDGVVVASAAVSQGPWDLAISPDNSTLFVITRTPKGIVPIATSNMAAGTLVTPTLTPWAIDVFPDGRGLLVGSEEAGLELEQFMVGGSGASATLTNYVDFDGRGSVHGVAISSKGAIYATDFTGSRLNLWPGGKVVADVGSDFWTHNISVVVERAA